MWAIEQTIENRWLTDCRVRTVACPAASGVGYSWV